MRNDIFVVVDVVFFSLSQFRIKTQTQFHADLYATVYEFLHFYLMYTFFGQVQNHSNIVLEKLMFFCCCSFSSLFLHFPFAVAVCMCFIFFGHFVFMCFFSAWAPSKNRMFLSVGRKLDLDLANRLTIKANGYARARPLKHCARSLQIYFIFQFSEFSLMLQLLSNVFVLALSHSLSLWKWLHLWLPLSLMFAVVVLWNIDIDFKRFVAIFAPFISRQPIRFCVSCFFSLYFFILPYLLIAVAINS